ncbi:hypothetical protein [Pseudomonas rhizoryzae]|uniref:hypothetical protein n=1 Tax=Pseudomonas rhizoryzae TaxID=2571129 RepID=UPI00079A681F|nr:hypothetical protein [Pseudomonas rhizoryzae]KTT31406.1 hypothetical protein SB9_18100 [Pseudomonas psychrotolerans]KTT35563.1 hypothetical protein NS201_00285 [Pseudomonas psychrotolerans]KTT74457.1 hypothetical protein SB18R_14860 [Pseudomonas psychrotolerans]
MRLTATLAMVGLLLAPAVMAAERNDLPSCYSYAQLASEQPAASGRALTVVIDETVNMPQALKSSAWEHTLRYLQPGDSIKLYQFSALLQNNYMKLQFAGVLEKPLVGKVRDRIGNVSLKKLDTCLQQQAAFFQKAFGKQFVESFGKPNEEISRSEIFVSLKKIGEDISQEPSENQVILLVSDMLENSDFGSFYQANRIRVIDPAAELAKVEKKELFAQLQGARVYVIGAGLIGNDAKGAYRSGKVMQSLERFWQGYFERSNATLVSFGTPELTTDLK